MEIQFHVYHAMEQKRLGPINLFEMGRLASSLDDRRRKTTLVWCQAWTDWRPLEEVIEQINNQQLAVPPPLPADETLVNSSEIPADQERGGVIPFQPLSQDSNHPTQEHHQKSSHPSDWTEKRKHPRYSVKLQVVISSGEKVFRAQTVNASLGGLKLTKELPSDFLGHECKIYIKNLNSGDTVLFVGQILGDANRLQFQEEVNVFQKKLEHWITPDQATTAA